ncbi:hypothetical protein PENSPDRAFT_291880 [Peniophora sp. CONT]|nr:hypothetical protein PENSPDRAFT_291880 [Peniophora sp. CONT]
MRHSLMRIFNLDRHAPTSRANRLWSEPSHSLRIHCRAYPRYKHSLPGRSGHRRSTSWAPRFRLLFDHLYAIISLDLSDGRVRTYTHV